MDRKENTRLTLEIDGTVVSWEVPYSDCSVEDILHGLYGLMVAQTFMPSSVIEGMRVFADGHDTATSANPICDD